MIYEDLITQMKLLRKSNESLVCSDPNKQVDLDKLRERGLLREFNKYVEEIDGTRKKLKISAWKQSARVSKKHG